MMNSKFIVLVIIFVLCVQLTSTKPRKIKDENSEKEESDKSFETSDKVRDDSETDSDRTDNSKSNTNEHIDSSKEHSLNNSKRLKKTKSIEEIIQELVEEPQEKQSNSDTEHDTEKLLSKEESTLKDLLDVFHNIDEIASSSIDEESKTVVSENTNDLSANTNELGSKSNSPNDNSDSSEAVGTSRKITNQSKSIHSKSRSRNSNSKYNSNDSSNDTSMKSKSSHSKTNANSSQLKSGSKSTENKSKYSEIKDVTNEKEISSENNRGRIKSLFEAAKSKESNNKKDTHSKSREGLQVKTKSESDSKSHSESDLKSSSEANEARKKLNKQSKSSHSKSSSRNSNSKSISNDSSNDTSMKSKSNHSKIKSKSNKQNLSHNSIERELKDPDTNTIINEDGTSLISFHGSQSKVFNDEESYNKAEPSAAFQKSTTTLNDNESSTSTKRTQYFSSQQTSEDTVRILNTVFNNATPHSTTTLRENTVQSTKQKHDATKETEVPSSVSSNTSMDQNLSSLELTAQTTEKKNDVTKETKVASSMLPLTSLDQSFSKLSKTNSLTESTFSEDMPTLPADTTITESKLYVSSLSISEAPVQLSSSAITNTSPISSTKESTSQTITSIDYIPNETEEPVVSSTTFKTPTSSTLESTSPTKKSIDYITNETEESVDSSTPLKDNESADTESLNNLTLNEDSTISQPAPSTHVTSAATLESTSSTQTSENINYITSIKEQAPILDMVSNPISIMRGVKHSNINIKTSSRTNLETLKDVPVLKLPREKPKTCNEMHECCVTGEINMNLGTIGRKANIEGELEGVSVRPLQKSDVPSYKCSYTTVIEVQFQQIDDAGCFGCMSAPFCGQRMLRLDLHFSTNKRRRSMFYINDGSNATLEGALIHGTYPNIMVYPNTFQDGNRTALLNMASVIGPNTNSLTLYVSNKHYRLVTDSGLDYSQCHEDLFHLNGQFDPKRMTQSPNVLRIGINQSPSGYVDPDDVGVGICNARLTWTCPWN